MDTETRPGNGEPVRPERRGDERTVVEHREIEQREIAARPPERPEERRVVAPTAARVSTSTSAAAMLGGAATIVLSVIALAGVGRTWLTPIAIICAVAGTLAYGTAVSAHFAHAMRTEPENVRAHGELGTGASWATFAGLGGIALGILALLRVATAVLSPIAVIALGAGLFLGAMGMRGQAEIGREVDTRASLVRAGFHSASAFMMLAGIGGMVLGVLALVGINPFVLTAVALLGIGGALLSGGGAAGGGAVIAARRRD